MTRLFLFLFLLAAPLTSPAKAYHSPLPGEGAGVRLSLPVDGPGGEALRFQHPLRDSLLAATTALEMNIDSVDLRLKRARWNMELEEWEYAKNDYDYILRRDPSNPAALFYRAYANERLGRFGFARLDYQNLLKVVPTSFEGKLGLALLNDRDNRHTEAMDQMNQLVEQFPDSALAYAARANMEAARQQHLLAEYDYSEAILRDPTNTDYILGRAVSALALGRKDAARRDLEHLIRLGVPRTALDEYFEKLRK